MGNEVRRDLGRCLALLFYFKSNKVVQVFEKSGLEFENAKSAFTSGIYKLDPKG